MFGHDDQQQNHNDNQWVQPEEHHNDQHTAQEPADNSAIPSAPEPEHDTQAQAANPWDQPTPSTDPAQVTTTSPVAPDNPDDLLAIKQKALEDLSPLVGHLDQTPEEKFNTTLMMIKATDNKELLPEAYKAAQSIIDEKKKAQALLEIINEVNYFTQKNS